MEMCMCNKMKTSLTPPFMKTRQKNLVTTFLLLEKFYPKFIKSETNFVTLYSGCVRLTKTRASLHYNTDKCGRSYEAGCNIFASVDAFILKRFLQLQFK